MADISVRYIDLFKLKLPAVLRREEEYIPFFFLQIGIFSKLSKFKHLIESKMSSSYLMAEEATALNSFLSNEDKQNNPTFTQHDIVINKSELLTYIDNLMSLAGFNDNIFVENCVFDVNKQPIIECEDKVSGGWFQVNNSVVPYLFRENIHHFPYAVLLYSTKVIFNHDITFFKMTIQEAEFLTNLCLKENLKFCFAEHNELIPMTEILKGVNVTYMQSLPSENPFNSIVFKDISAHSDYLGENSSNSIPEKNQSSIFSQDNNIPSSLKNIQDALTEDKINNNAQLFLKSKTKKTKLNVKNKPIGKKSNILKEAIPSPNDGSNLNEISNQIHINSKAKIKNKSETQVIINNDLKNNLHAGQNIFSDLNYLPESDKLNNTGNELINTTLFNKNIQCVEIENDLYLPLEKVQEYFFPNLSIADLYALLMKNKIITRITTKEIIKMFEKFGEFKSHELRLLLVSLNSMKQVIKNTLNNNVSFVINNIIAKEPSNSFIFDDSYLNNNLTNSSISPPNIESTIITRKDPDTCINQSLNLKNNDQEEFNASIDTSNGIKMKIVKETVLNKINTISIPDSIFSENVIEKKSN